VPSTRRSSSARAVGARPNESPLDDWLGDISDDDWSEPGTERAARRRAAPSRGEPSVSTGELGHRSGSAPPPPARPVAAAEARRPVVERRRLIAGVVLAVVLGVGIGIPVVLLTGGEQATVTQPTSTTTGPTDTSPETTPARTPTTPTEQTDTTTKTGSAAAEFTLPEGVKLQREGENDRALVSQLQEALADAGFDPGSADGTFGEQTEAAVVAFQQANGLSVDGRVGPETAEALNQALASG
jgi:Putative peptidoglycan binding domain